MKGLKKLKITHVNLEQTGLLSLIVQSLRLTSLTLSHCQLLNIEKVKDAIGLEQLNVSHNKITLEDPDVLYSLLRCFKRVDLSFNPNILDSDKL